MKGRRALLNGPTEFGELYPTEKQWTSSPTKMCRSGDILFCVRGATAGRLNMADKAYCLGRGLAAIRAKGNSDMNNAVLCVILDRYYDYFQQKGVGSTFINISRDELASLPIPVADRSKTAEFAARTERHRELKNASKQALGALDELFATLQHRAFRGEL